MLSPGGSIDGYRATLERLGELARSASWVIPGHGAPIDAERALEILAEDVSYLERLASEPADATPPRSSGSTAQKRIHEANLAFLGVT
jgi:glyoxylase-like metal-dependent hydrolase (beta-lactamase superfamily II)